jgi:hypothetical protein
MFGLRNSRRQPNASLCKQRDSRSRRLRVEMMEGRLMLAASPLDASQGTADTVQPAWTLMQLGSTAGYVQTFQSQMTDGGFVNYHYADPSSDKTFTLSGSNFVEVSASWKGPVVLGTSNSAVASDTLFGTTPRVSPIGDTGLNAAVIVPDLDSRDTGSPLSPLDIKPVVIGPSPNQPGPNSPGRSEGGSIPIHAIFADFRQDGHLASGVKSVSSLLTEASVDLRTSAHVAATSAEAVAGEWARATVFEIAGGEPAALNVRGEKNTNNSDNGDTVRQSGPLSTIESRHQSTGHRATTFPQARVTNGQFGEPARPEGPLMAHDAAANLTNLTNGANGEAIAYSPPFAQAKQTGAANPETLAVETLFHDLGEDRIGVVESNIHGKSWLRTIGTSPLLIALALERIAALNSRRARRDARTAPAKMK